ncbi:hypothetical protein ABTA48_19840, partial [Acinetobacter baumannii]
MAEVIAAFDRVRKGAAPPLAVEGCNGYWHGRPGMLRAEEAGLGCTANACSSASPDACCRWRRRFRAG